MNKILLIKHGSLGDIISSTSAIHDIRNHYSDYKIFVLTTEKYKTFFKGSNIIDEILIDKKKGLLSILLIKKIIKLNFEIIIDLQNSQRTSLYTLLIRLFSRIKINGTTRFSNYKYNYLLKKPPPVIDGLSNQIEILGIKTTRKPYLTWLDDNSFDMSSINNKNFFIINPGCSKKHIQKKWSAENYAKICSYLVSKNILPIVIGSSLDRESIEIINQHEKKILNLINNSPLNVIFQLSKKAIGAISNDTGPAHLIAASGCKIHLIISIFSDFKTVIPQGSNVSFTQKENIQDIAAHDIIEVVNSIIGI